VKLVKPVSKGEAKERTYTARVTKYTIKRRWAYLTKGETVEQAEAKAEAADTRGTFLRYNHIVARWDKKRGLLWRIAPIYEFDSQDRLDCYYKLTDASTASILRAQADVAIWLGAGIMDPDQGAELLALIDPLVLARLAE
jgi:hypothetical protein